MKLRNILALASLAVAGAACHSTTVLGPGGRSLTATTQRHMTIARGGSAPLEVGIDRQQFTGPVVVSIFALPDGVTSDTSSIRAEATSATFILRADRTADRVGDHAVGITVEDTDGRRATQYVGLSVTE